MFGKQNKREYEWLQSAYRYALSLTHHPQDAEDAVQTACVKLYSTYGRIKHKRVLFTTIRNLIIDQQRQKTVIQFQALDVHEVAQESYPSTQEWYAATVDIERLLACLRPEEREVLYLHLVEGYTAREIGSLTGHPRNTVLSLLHRARHKLQEAFSVESPA
jgi:RNA polymerase sigma-70 factor (ECF subfamily)